MEGGEPECHIRGSGDWVNKGWRGGGGRVRQGDRERQALRAPSTNQRVGAFDVLQSSRRTARFGRFYVQAPWLLAEDRLTTTKRLAL